MAHHTRSGGRPVRPGQENTTHHQQPTTPAVRRRIQQHTNKTSRAFSRLQHHKPGWRTTRAREAGPSVPARKTPQTTNSRPRNKTSRASSRLQHHEPKPEHADTARPTNWGATHKHGTPKQGGGARTSTAPTPAKPTKHNRNHNPPNGRRQHKPNTTTAAGGHQHSSRSKRGDMDQHSTPHHEGDHKPTQHAPPGGEARTSTAPTPARQTPQTTNTRQRRLYGGGDNSEPTKPAGHPAGYNTMNGHPNTPTQHAPPRGGPRTNTAQTPAKPTTQPRPQPTQQQVTTQTKHHHHGSWPPTQHAPARGGPHTNIARPTKGGGARTSTARPNRGGGTHQHSTNPGQSNTTDNQHPTMPALRWRRQQRTNKTSRASSRLQHHEPKPEHADAALPTKGGATHKHGTPQQGRGHAPAQHQPRPSQQHNRDHNPSNG